MPELDDRLSEGRDGISTMDPPADLWARVLERSTDGDAVVHDLATSRHRRRPPMWLAVASVAAVLAVVVALIRFEDDQAVDVVPATEVPSVTGVPQVTGPAPNGWVAFNSIGSGGGGGYIYLVRPGEDARRLEVAGSDTTTYESCPTWSPDGTRLLFSRLTGSSDTTPGDAELVIVPVGRDGTAGVPTVIALDGFFDDFDDFHQHPCAIWAPDGRWVALAGGTEVWVVDTQTSTIRHLPNLQPIDLEWRPGTDELALTGYLGPHDEFPTPVTVYSVSTSELHLLSSVETGSLTWSPDGSTLAYMSGEEDRLHPAGLWLVDADGANERLLVADTGTANHGVGPVWSPTGDRIVYQRLCCGRGETHEVVLVNVADGSQTVIAPPQTDGVRWWPWTVAWSPDGTTLLYTAWSDAPGSAEQQGLIAVPAEAPTNLSVLAESRVDSFAPAHHQGVLIQNWGRQPG